MFAYEYALRANPKSIPALNAMSLILRTKEDFGKAIEYLQIILGMDNTNGEVWGSLGKFRALSFRARSKALTCARRSLLPHDGQSTRGIQRVSTSTVQPPESKGTSHFPQETVMFGC